MVFSRKRWCLELLGLIQLVRVRAFTEQCYRQTRIPPTSDSFRKWESLALWQGLTCRNGNIFLCKGYKSQYLYFLSSLFHTQKWMFCWIPIFFLLYHLSLSATDVLFTSDVIKCWKAPPNQCLLSIKPYIFASRFTYEWVSTR